MFCKLVEMERKILEWDGVMDGRMIGLVCDGAGMGFGCMSNW